VQRTVDRKIVEEQMVESADLIHLQVDSSTFGRYSMQTVLVTLMYINWKGEDALGTGLSHVNMK
jgi:hypothetical protein